jgi:hypothetical protein
MIDHNISFRGGITMVFRLIATMFATMMACGTFASDDVFYDDQGNAYHTGLKKPKFMAESTVLTDDDGNTYRTGLVRPPNWKMGMKFKSVLGEVGALPTKFDWRENPMGITPVENQGSCGSCWAFATAAVMQDVLRLTGQGSNDISEQALLSCSNPGVWTCQGGWFAHDYHIYPGAVPATDFPYVGADVVCKYGIQHKWFLNDWAYLPLDTRDMPQREELKAAIYKYGPVAVGVAAGGSMSNYRGGVYCGTETQLNHAVVLVGWDDNQGVWFMKNSWGAGWGENGGYMRIKYDCNGIGTNANFVMTGTLPVPHDNPGPSPNPTPTPDPTCEPQPVADTGYPDEFEVELGKSYLLGIPAVKGTKYVWKADPSFDGNAVPKTAQIRYKPNKTKTLTITATNKCGSISASTIFYTDVSFVDK